MVGGGENVPGACTEPQGYSPALVTITCGIKTRRERSDFCQDDVFNQCHTHNV